MDQRAGSDSEDVSDAVRLFAARVAEVMPGFDLEMWRQECAEICSRLDAIPLAIELAAARATMLTPREILERLDDRFSLLTGSSRTSSGRHATLQAAIDWSYDLLDEAGQRLLQKLAIFRGGFTIGSVRAVCFEDDVAETEVLDLLSGLRSRSLVTQAIGHRGTRFGLLESIREYAIARLRDQGRYESLEQRHREHFTALARGESLRLNRSEQLEALDVLEDDHDNLRAVLARSTDAGDFEAAADMAGSLTLFWFFHAHFTEAERWAERVLPALPVEPGKAWLRLLLGAVQYDTRTGHLSRAAERVGEALRIATERNAPRTEMWARAYLATIDLYRIDMASAQREAGIALDIADRIGDFIGLGYATFIDVGVEAWRARLNDDLSFDRANELLERLGPVVIGARAAGDRNIIGHVVQMEAQLLDATGRHETAATAFDEAIRSFADLGNVACACHCFEAIAMYAAAGEDFAAAARILGATSRLRSRVGITPAPIEIELRDHALSLSEAALSTEAAESEIITGAEMSLAELAQYTRGLLA